MCHFVSWIEHGRKILFLTDEELETEKGQQLKEYLGDYCLQDINGHGAIRHYFFGSSDKIIGFEKECSDFSTPDNFPLAIVDAIKKGVFVQMGVCVEILTLPAQAEYYKIERPALDEYYKIQTAALDEYDKIQRTALAKYEKIKRSEWTEYQKIEKVAWAKYQKIARSALAKYQKIKRSAFWDIAKIPENRIEIWR